MGEFSITHWAVVLIIILIFFGPSKLPGLGKSLGEAIRDFKKGINDLDNQKPDVKEISHTPAPQIPTTTTTKETDKTQS
jgi:sec-independent protein translocase protein TatA